MAARKQTRPITAKNGRVIVPKRPKNLKKPLGWLPTPPAIERMVRASMPAIASEKAIRDQINFDTLRYYYGGDIVLYQEDERGVEVIAAGEDVLPTARNMTEEQKLVYITAWPFPWE